MEKDDATWISERMLRIMPSGKNAAANFEADLYIGNTVNSVDGVCLYDIWKCWFGFNELIQQSSMFYENERKEKDDTTFKTSY